jgi:hypothetical protein
LRRVREKNIFQSSTLRKIANGKREPEKECRTCDDITVK